MKLRIVPNDTLFFRDGKPFSLGSETWADNVFPPFPSTLYGSIRTAFIAHRGGLQKFHNNEFEDKIGTRDDLPQNGLRVRTLYLAHSDSARAASDRAYLPAPLDLAVAKGKSEEVLRLRPHREEQLISSQSRLIPIRWENIHREIEAPERAYLQQTIFWERYFTDMDYDFSLKAMDEILVDEPKVGIARNRDTRTSEVGRLYRVGMSRLRHGWSLHAEIDGLDKDDLPANGMLRLGGENKTVVYSRLEAEIEDATKEKEKLKEYLQQDRQFKLYLMTPAIFAINGWMPDEIDAGNHAVQGLPAKLVAAAVGKPLHIGGWDLGNNCPKEMLRAVPAGSVYYLELEDSAGETEIEAFIDRFHRQNIGKDDMTIQGFGYCLITRWRKVKNDEQVC